MTHKIKMTTLKLVSAILLFVPAAALSAAFSVPFMSATASAAGAAAAQPNVTQDEINKQLKCGTNGNVDQAQTGTNAPDCSTTCSNNQKTASCNSFNDILKKIINILSVLVGAIAVIMIIIGGFRYVTSAGNDSSTGAARKTIMYAIIGLIIVALAQVIVHFVLNNIT